MNPSKRKKLYRMELQNKSVETQTVKEEKVIQKEELLVVQQENLTNTVTNTELKLTETVEVLDSKKDKKKKLSSQDV